MRLASFRFDISTMSSHSGDKEDDGLGSKPPVRGGSQEQEDGGDGVLVASREDGTPPSAGEIFAAVIGSGGSSGGTSSSGDESDGSGSGPVVPVAVVPPPVSPNAGRTTPIFQGHGRHGFTWGEDGGIEHRGHVYKRAKLAKDFPPDAPVVPLASHHKAASNCGEGYRTRKCMGPKLARRDIKVGSLEEKVDALKGQVDGLRKTMSSSFDASFALLRVSP